MATKFIHGLQSDEDYMKSAGEETEAELLKANRDKMRGVAAGEFARTLYTKKGRQERGKRLARRSADIRAKVGAHRAQRRKIIQSRKAY
jgi:hypothetical protein